MISMRQLYPSSHCNFIRCDGCSGGILYEYLRIDFQVFLPKGQVPTITINNQTHVCTSTINYNTCMYWGVYNIIINYAIQCTNVCFRFLYINILLLLKQRGYWMYIIRCYWYNTIVLLITARIILIINDNTARGEIFVFSYRKIQIMEKRDYLFYYWSNKVSVLKLYTRKGRQYNTMKRFKRGDVFRSEYQKKGGEMSSKL